MGGASKEAVAMKKVEEQVGIIHIQLQSHGTDIQDMKLRMDNLLHGQDQMNQKQDEMKSALDKVMERLDFLAGAPS